MATLPAHAGTDRSVSALTQALRLAARRFAEATFQWSHHANAAGALPELPDLAPLESTIVRTLGTDPAGVEGALAALKICEDIRRIDRLTIELARRAGSFPAGVSAELREQLVRLRDITAAQLDAAVECLQEGDVGRIRRTLREEAVLDDWQDVLVGEVLGEMGEAPMDTAVVVSLLASARLLERIGGHAQHIVGSALRLDRAA
jgi:phosphate uptake regulator